MTACGRAEVMPHHSEPRHYLKVSGQLHAPVALTPRKEPPVPIGEEVGWIPEPVWTTWSGDKSLVPAGN
jgi:hypothetical protein